MLKLKKIAITGGLASGKSSVSRIFKELGAYVVSADEIVHQSLSPESPLGAEVVALLGEEIVKAGKIDRSVIAKKVFSNPALLKSLEMLLHPVVLKEIEKQYQQVNKQGTAPLFVAEIPLLFEVSGAPHFDATVAVWADPETSLKRFQTSTGYGKEEYDNRMANQISAEEKTKQADYIIDNTGDLKHLRNQVEALYRKLTQ